LSDRSLKLAVIIGSMRKGRFGDTVVRWFSGQADTHGEFSVDLIDLADIKLPPTHRARPTDGVRAFCARVEAKPVWFVSYGGISGGVRAIEHLRQVHCGMRGRRTPMSKARDIKSGLSGGALCGGLGALPGPTRSFAGSPL